ncbi:MAG TPA: hypothetical protein GX501_05545 [Clostridiaceae bacterium]|nr:hypothetical protein [Clostridiaceae bacterium]
MNKLINDLFEKDVVIKIVSVLTAILIWFVVLDSTNPFEERTITVPLTSNIDILQSKSLQIVGTQLPTSVEVKIKGRRSKISSVTANDFKASIDLSGVKEPGYKKISIDEPEYTGAQDIIIMGISPETVSLNFEKVIDRQYPVNVEFTGSLPAGYEILNLKVDPSNVILEEKESSISRVSKVVAFVNLDEADDNKEMIIRGSVLDSDGQLLKQFEGKVPVIVSFNLAKKVPVTVAATGKPANDYYLKDIRYSLSEVRIIGARNLLEGIKAVSAEAIDITDRSESFYVPLQIKTPKGVSVHQEDSERLFAEVIIEKYITRVFSISSGSVSIYGADQSGTMEYRIMDAAIPITLKGKAEDLENIKISDIKLSIRVSGLEPGRHEVPVSVQVHSAVSLVGEYSVNLMVTDTSASEANSPAY